MNRAGEKLSRCCESGTRVTDDGRVFCNKCNNICEYGEDYPKYNEEL